MHTVTLKSGREKSIRQRHPWVFSGAIAGVRGDPEPGEIVRVEASTGEFLAYGYYNDQSKITVRTLEWDENKFPGDDWWADRVREAIDRRGRMAAKPDTTAYRLVHSESDFLPGLIVDRYADVTVVQFLTAGVERVRNVLVRALVESTGSRLIYERSDADTRRREGLAPSTGPLWTREGDAGIDRVDILENGIRFRVDFSTAQKTGFYLDQRENRRIVSSFAAGRRVLDVFSYTGAFSAACAGAGADALTLVESSATAAGLAAANLELNGVARGGFEIVRGDAFEALREMRDVDRRFDLVVVDPPKFARTRAQARKALRAYKDVNLLAMKLLEPGGFLATFSCSGGVGTEAFSLAVAWAGLDAERHVQVLSRMGQPNDHPVLAAVPETEYLKGLLCRVL